MIVDVTVATGACAGEELEPVDTTQVTLTQQGNSVTISGPFGDSGPQNLNGNLTSGVVSVGGNRRATKVGVIAKGRSPVADRLAAENAQTAQGE